MESKRQQVIDVATRLFAELGFENTSMASICAEAGVSKGLIYHHFATKNELLREIFSATTLRMIEISQASEATSAPHEQLATLISQLFKQLQEDKSFFQLNLNIMLQPGTRSILHDLIQERSAHLMTSVRHIFDQIDPDNSELCSYMFIAELDGIALDFLSIFDSYPIEALKNHMINRYSKA
ncbi:MAG: TetR/AcrR family transcriptional regulator [Roseivirga sp.]|nr:TetR/AcrR family transcriptional regulator [Roseivirga sp.]